MTGISRDGSGSGSSLEDCPVEFSSETDRPAPHHAPVCYYPAPLGYCPSPALQLKIETSLGHLKIKSYHRNGRPKCGVCWNPRTNFYCQECVIAGDFAHSSKNFYERFADKHLRLFSLQRDIAEAKAAIGAAVAGPVAQRQLKEEIRQLRTRLKHIRHLVRTKAERVAAAQLNLTKLRASNSKREDRLPEYVDKVDKIRQCVERFRNDMRGIKALYADQKYELNHVRIRLVESLEDIFPVEEVFPTQPDHCDVMLDCLTDAMRTSYIHGRWVSVEQSGELQYRIVAPLLTSSGDYTPVYALIATSKEGSAGVEPQPAYNISAGLTLLTQLIKLIAHITAVPLPIKLSYADFGVIETSEYRFSKKVAKLNIITVTLCLALGVDPLLIRPCQTVYNVITLVKHLMKQRYEAVDPLYRSELVESFPEFGYFAPVTDGVAAADWEAAIHRESEELRRLVDPEDETEGDIEDENSLQDWESVAADDFSDTLSSSPSDRTLERPPSSSLSFVSSTVSSLLWGISSPKSPRK